MAVPRTPATIDPTSVAVRKPKPIPKLGPNRKVYDLPVNWKCLVCNRKGRFFIDRIVDPEAIMEICIGMHHCYAKHDNFEPCVVHGGVISPRDDRKVGFSVTLNKDDVHPPQIPLSQDLRSRSA